MRIRGAAIKLLDHILRWLHAAPKYPNPRTPTLDDLSEYAESKGIPFHLAEDSHPQAAVDFVRRADPGLGVSRFMVLGRGRWIYSGYPARVQLSSI